MNIKILLIFILFFASFLNLRAQIILPSVFSDNMVLQRNSEVNFWGWAERGSKVQVIPSWSRDTLTVIVNGHARFDTKLSVPKAGGPYKIEITNGIFKQVVNNILIGEVWLCSGQSNMEWNSKNGLKEIIEELPNANNNNIRLLHVNRYGSYFPQENFSNKWQLCDSNTVKGFSAIGYFYAKRLQKELGVPIGIISANMGGTIAEVWVPDTVVNNDLALAADAKTYTPSSWRPMEPGTLWNTMIHPLVGFNIAGVLWYQGESNVGKYVNYNKLMTKLVNSWRDAWKMEFPFYYVQIAPYDYQSKPDKQLAALLREQQIKLLNLKKTGMVVVSDLVENVKDIHPSQKIEVAKRLADLALSDVYKKKNFAIRSPVYKSHQIVKNQIIIDFNYIDDGLVVKRGSEINYLFIAGDNRIYLPAKYIIKGKQLIVYHNEIKNPTAVRFSFSDKAVANLFTKSGLPVSPFRTDHWDL